MVILRQPSSTNIWAKLQIQIQKYKIAEKYENTSLKNRYFHILWSFYTIVGSVTSWMNIKYPYIIEFKLLLDRDRIDPLSGGKSFIL